MKSLNKYFVHSDRDITRTLLRRRNVPEAAIRSVISKYSKYRGDILLSKNIRRSTLHTQYQDELQGMYDSKAADVLEIKRIVKTNPDLRFCPYCGINLEIASIDHYQASSLKAEFSFYSENLIPSCSVCNEREKGDQKAVLKGVRQFFHPYIDNITGLNVLGCSISTISPSEIGIEFYIKSFADPTMEGILKNHLKNLNLKYRYGDTARRFIVDKVESYKILLRNGNYSAVIRDLTSRYRTSLSEDGNNHWKTVFLHELRNVPTIVQNILGKNIVIKF